MKNSLKNRIKNKIKRSKSSVFMIADFKRLSSNADQIQRVLRQLIAENIVVRVGKGVYVRAIRSCFSGNIIPEKDIRTVAEEFIRRHGGEVRLTPEQLAYNER
ncbi:MAG: DUF6088 family protein, partial [Deferribacteraceae bacterium]|nr:DUF6088 family protein [Deferribacteraceae bacterium]